MIRNIVDFPGNVVAVACSGSLTKAEYDAVVVPAVTEALARHDKVRIYCEIDSGFSGIEPAAMWEDFRIGMDNFSRWERIAVVTDVEWIARSIQFFGIMMPCPVRVFPTREEANGRAWIVAP